jgi:hypothetical protein
MATEPGDRSDRKETVAPEPDSRKKRMAARVLRRILDDLSSTRYNYALGAIYAGLLFIPSICCLVFAEQEDDSARIVAMVTGPAFVIMVLGYKMTSLFPYFWNITAALALSALAAVSIYKGDIPPVLLAVATALWISVFVGYFKTRMILREYPDIRISMDYVARDGKLYRDPVRPKGRVARRLAAREEADRSRSRRSLAMGWILAAIAAAVFTAIVTMS